MKEYCRIGTCRRQYLSSYFGDKYICEQVKLHDCCDNCAAVCNCDFCLTHGTDEEESEDSQPSHEQRSQVKYALQQYFDAANSLVASMNEDTLDPSLYTGLTSELLLDIAKNHENLLSFDIFFIAYPYIDVDYAKEIVNIINHCISF